MDNNWGQETKAFIRKPGSTLITLKAELPSTRSESHILHHILLTWQVTSASVSKLRNICLRVHLFFLSRVPCFFVGTDWSPDHSPWRSLVWGISPLRLVYKHAFLFANAFTAGKCIYALMCGTQPTQCLVGHSRILGDRLGGLRCGEGYLLKSRWHVANSRAGYVRSEGCRSTLVRGPRFYRISSYWLEPYLVPGGYLLC